MNADTRGEGFDGNRFFSYRGENLRAQFSDGPIWRGKTRCAQWPSDARRHSPMTRRQDAAVGADAPVQRGWVTRHAPEHRPVPLPKVPYHPITGLDAPSTFLL